MSSDRDPEPSSAPPAEAASAPERKRSLGPLRMIWRAAMAYPGWVLTAGLALVVTASATLAIPSGFRLIIDRGFAIAQAVGVRADSWITEVPSRTRDVDEPSQASGV